VYIKNVIENNNFIPKIEKIIYHYSIYQPLFNDIHCNVPIDFVEGLQINCYENTNVNTLIIIDDLINEAIKSKHVSDLFIRGSHHLNKSVLLTTQNLYEKGLRTLSLNSQYLTIFRQPRGIDQITTLGKQLSSGPFLLEVYKDATKEAYTYLLISLHPQTEDKLKFAANIFQESNKPITIYTPKER
jgi:hypothetical protein